MPTQFIDTLCAVINGIEMVLTIKAQHHYLWWALEQDWTIRLISWCNPMLFSPAEECNPRQPCIMLQVWRLPNSCQTIRGCEWYLPPLIASATAENFEGEVDFLMLLSFPVTHEFYKLCRSWSLFFDGFGKSFHVTMTTTFSFRIKEYRFLETFGELENMNTEPDQDNIKNW